MYFFLLFSGVLANQKECPPNCPGKQDGCHMIQIAQLFSELQHKLRERERDGGRDRKYCEERQMQKWKSPSIENQMLIHRSLSLGRDGSNTCGMVRQFHSDQVHLPAPNPQLARPKPNLFTKFYSSIVSCFTKGRHMRLSLVCNVYPIFFQMTIVFCKK